MRGRQQDNIAGESDHSELQFAYINDSIQPLESNNQHLLDQAFIIYSDEEMMSVSSHSQNSSFSRESKLSSYSNIQSQSEFQNISNNKQSGGNILGSLANEESSIYDMKQSQCSESGKELMHDLEPLFKGKTFLRRSPRFATYDQSLNRTQNNISMQKTMKSMKLSSGQRQKESQMIDDQESVVSANIQNTQILEQKYQNPTSLTNNTTQCGSLNLNSQKFIDNQLLEQKQVSLAKVTRSSKKISCQGSHSISNLFNQTGANVQRNTNQYLSKITKDYIMTTKKQKKIKKTQRNKPLVSNGGYKGHQYQHRYS